MSFVTRRSLCLILGTLCSACGVQAQSQPSQAEAKAFVSQYVAAFNAKDVARWEALFTAESRACITSENKDYYDTTRAMTWRDPIPANYTFTVSPVNEGNLKAVESFGRFPLKPERELHIDYQQGDDLGSEVIYLVRENGRWLADQPCASQEMIKEFRDQAPERARFKSMADAIQEPLRSQLIALLREHETAQAIDRYMKATGKDGRTSMLVMNALALDARK
jgi:hypothetical protein